MNGTTRSPAETLDRRQFLGMLGAGAAGLAMSRLGLAAGAGEAGRKPNFVIIFTDDQGYQDLGCFGSPDIKTPNVDRMAAEGMKFTDFYVAGPVCTPSRAALLTGCYPARVGLARGVLFPASTTGLHHDEVTLAELLKAQGYATACVGKWHLGHLPEFLPTRQGFDSYFGIPYSNDMPTLTADGKRGCVLLRNEQVIEHPVDQADLTERYTQEAVKFIQASKGRPFLLYLPHSMPHTPLHVSQRFAGKSARGLYGDVIECIDWSTGQVLQALKDAGVDEHTLVIYTSDNGPWLVKGPQGGSALPLRSGKGTVYEGGMREPCVMRWPGKIPAGKTCSELATTMDLLPTLTALAGTRPPTDRVIDGRDIRPLISAQPGARTPHEAFFYYNRGGDMAAVRAGNLKLHLPRPGRKETRKDRTGQTVETEIPAAGAELYDLAADIAESKDIAAEQPQAVARLEAMARKFDEDLRKNSRPAGTAKAT